MIPQILDYNIFAEYGIKETLDNIFNQLEQACAGKIETLEEVFVTINLSSSRMAGIVNKILLFSEIKMLPPLDSFSYRTITSIRFSPPCVVFTSIPGYIVDYKQSLIALKIFRLTSMALIHNLSSGWSRTDFDTEVTIKNRYRQFLGDTNDAVVHEKIVDHDDFQIESTLKSFAIRHLFYLLVGRDRVRISDVKQAEDGAYKIYLLGKEEDVFSFLKVLKKETFTEMEIPER